VCKLHRARSTAAAGFVPENGGFALDDVLGHVLRAEVQRAGGHHVHANAAAHITGEESGDGWGGHGDIRAGRLEANDASDLAQLRVEYVREGHVP
jgi:hypothetical protein